MIIRASVICRTTNSVRPNYELREIEWFFEDYQDVMHREVDVEGFLGPEPAHESLQMCREHYQDEFPNGWQE